MNTICIDVNKYYFFLHSTPGQMRPGDYFNYLNIKTLHIYYII